MNEMRNIVPNVPTTQLPSQPNPNVATTELLSQPNPTSCSQPNPTTVALIGRMTRAKSTKGAKGVNMSQDA
ncbi:hypothetical protein LIER_38948 [Lithospermum erythrorhizon]|uniref:Uncharacterized protein n=1 Tax=Lithospermum erythrorhizon TaxID=34254 RepID=A0AAV3QAG0_LITER